MSACVNFILLQIHTLTNTHTRTHLISIYLQELSGLRNAHAQALEKLLGCQEEVDTLKAMVRAPYTYTFLYLYPYLDAYSYPFSYPYPYPYTA